MRPPPNAVPRTAPATRGLLRVVRGSVVGLSAAGLGVLGHALAGGMLPEGRALAVVTGALVVVTVAMSGRRWQLPSLVSVLLGSQLAFHVALADSSHEHLVPGGAHNGVLTPASTMTTAHVVAALLTALLLRRVDEWCSLLVDLLGRTLRTPRLALLPVTVLPATARRSLDERPDQWLVHWLSRRGPPARTLA